MIVLSANNLTKTYGTDVIIDKASFHLNAGDKVQLSGFGTFEVRERAERKGRNPKTGEDIPIPATKVPAFKAGKALKDAVAK